jgi:hypothetical protein
MTDCDSRIVRETKTIIHLIKRHSFIDMREKSETPDGDTSETPRGMIDS